VLTKRAKRLRDMLSGPLAFASLLDHVWWGVSVEDREYGIPRIDLLRQTPAAVRFLSIEPLLEDLGDLNLEGIHWVIVGGESGSGARPMAESWVLKIRDQCQAAGIPFFFKQWGGVRKAHKGRILEERTYDAMPDRKMRKAAPHESRAAVMNEIKNYNI
jgi:protein gp37